MFDVLEDIVVLKAGGNSDRTLTYQMSKQIGSDGGSVPITVAAAVTTGSTVVSGAEPWPPRPNSVTFRLSLLHFPILYAL